MLSVEYDLHGPTITLEQTSFSMPPAVMSHWADAELMPLDGKEEGLRPFMLTQIMREVNASICRELQ